jgi:NAD(P)-dependent dehydrogenase (short-subunit alcohol dehydrogenase family)
MKRISVLITGASTGIGLAAAYELASKEHEVFAGVRNEADAQRVRDVDARIQPVIIDVTKSDTIAAAYKTIDSLRSKELLFSLVNNAGIAVSGPIEALAISEFRKQFDVNVFGLIETTQVFLPMIRSTKGRIVNISSVNGFLTPPFLGAYAASKHAVEAISDALRRELLPEDIKVIIVQPGPISTPIWKKGLDAKEQIRSSMNPERIGRYEKSVEVFEAEVEMTAKGSIPASVVAAKILHALTAKNPKLREVVAAPSKLVEFTIGRSLPAGMLDSLIKRHFSRARR